MFSRLKNLLHSFWKSRSETPGDPELNDAELEQMWMKNLPASHPAVQYYESKEDRAARQQIEDLAYEYINQGTPSPGYIETQRAFESISMEQELVYEYPIPGTNKHAVISIASNRPQFRDQISQTVLDALDAAIFWHQPQESANEVLATLRRMLSVFLHRSQLMVVHPDDLKKGLDDFVKNYELKRAAGCTPEEAHEDAVSRFKGFLDEKS